MMTKRELIEALEKSAAPDDAPVILQDDAGYWEAINQVTQTTDENPWVIIVGEFANNGEHNR